MGYRNISQTLLPTTPITAPQTIISDEFLLSQKEQIGLQANFVYGSGGTACKVYLQTSLDGGTTWFDIASIAFATASLRKLCSVKLDIATAAAVTASDGALTDNTILDGIIGDRVRVKTVVTGTYAGGTTLVVTACFN